MRRSERLRTGFVAPVRSSLADRFRREGSVAGLTSEGTKADRSADRSGPPVVQPVRSPLPLWEGTGLDRFAFEPKMPNLARLLLSAESRKERRHYLARLVALEIAAEDGCDCPDPFPVFHHAVWVGRFRRLPVHTLAHLPSCPVLRGHECRDHQHKENQHDQ